MNRRKALSGLGILIGGTMLSSPSALYVDNPFEEEEKIEKNTSVRKRKILSDNWRFQMDIKYMGDRDNWYAENYDRSVWGKVNKVPQAWDCYEDAFWAYEGVGWFSTAIDQDDFVAGKRLELIFHRVMYYSKVWVNGEYLGENIGGYLPFSFDISNKLKSNQKNNLVIRVDNRPRIDWLPAAEQIEWIQYGGLLEPIELVSYSPIFIDDLHILTIPENGKAKINCTANIVNQTNILSEIEVAVEIKYGAQSFNKIQKIKCVAKESTKINFDFELDRPNLWSPDTPVLYTAIASIKKENIVLDDLTEKFGIRKINVEGTSILLNGKPVTIKGVHRYDAYDKFGPTPPEKLVREELALMKSVGINLIRVHYPQAPNLIALFDEYGFFLMEEIPLNWWGQTNYTKILPIGGKAVQSLAILDQAKSTLRKMIARDKNHPCIIIWSMANESVTYSETGIKVMRELLKLAKSLDATRLVTFVAEGEAVKHLAFDEADIVCFNKYVDCDYIHQIDSVAYLPLVKELAEYRSYFGNKPILMTEFGREGIKGMHGDVWASEEFQSAYIESMWKALKNNSTISGGIVWTWADYFHEPHFALNASYGPYGVVTGDRKQKLSLDTLTSMYGGTRNKKK